MSYLLDALRKSEEERNKSRVPPVRSGFAFVKDDLQPKNKFTFGLILTSCMLVAAFILGAGWWWSQKQRPDSVVPEERTRPSEIEVDARNDTSSEPSPAISKPPAVPTAIETQPTVIETMPAAVEAQTVQPTPFTAEIPYLAEMSIEFQNRVPELKFSGHVYSPEPGLRMIMINDAVAREGTPIGIDLALDEITETGVILRLDQTRFRIKLF